jgi:hypothetical protein
MPQWVQFRDFTNSSTKAHLVENPATGVLYAAHDYSESVLLLNVPFAANVVVGIDLAEHSIFGNFSNVFQTMQYNGTLTSVSYPAGLPTPTFTSTSTSPYITESSVGYSSQARSLKPVNRIIGVTFCRKFGGTTQEGPLAVIPGQAPYGIMFEGDVVKIALTLNMAKINLEGITHIRLYRTIAGLDSGEQVGNELDTDWHLVSTIAVRTDITYNDGGAATTDPLDLYLAKDFYKPQYKASYFGLLESGWFYMVSDVGDVSASERYLHYAWPSENRAKIPGLVTGAVGNDDNVYIGTTHHPYIVSVSAGEGEQGVQMAAAPFPERLPCLPGSMVAAAGGALYASAAGLVSLSRQGQRVITSGIMNADNVLYKMHVDEVIGPPSYAAYNEEVRVTRTINAAYMQGKYYGFVKSYQNVDLDNDIVKHCYIYDTGDGINGDKQFQQLVTMNVPEGILSQALVCSMGLALKYTNQVFYLPLPGEGGVDKGYRKALKYCFQWKSKKFVMPGQTTFAAGKIIHDCGGAITFRLYVDCKCVWQTEICDCNPFRIPSQIMGLDFEVELLGRSAVYEVHIAGSMRELLENE